MRRWSWHNIHENDGGSASPHSETRQTDRRTSTPSQGGSGEDGELFISFYLGIRQDFPWYKRRVNWAQKTHSFPGSERERRGQQEEKKAVLQTGLAKSRI